MTSPRDLPKLTLPAHETCRHKAYALTCLQYEQLIARADGRCEVCRRAGGPTPRTKLHIDHDCKLGMWAVRGLLCVDCNTRLQWPALADRLPAYLAESWYLGLLAECGIEPGAAFPEPPRGSRVFNHDEWIWKRYATGWVRQGSSHHLAHIPKPWAKLVYLYGPHLRLIRRPA